VRHVARRARSGAQGRGRDLVDFGQLIVAAASIADFGAIILLSIFFSGEGGTGSTLLLLGSVFALAVVVFVVTRGAEHSMRIRDDLVRLQDTTAQIRVRGAFLLFVAFAAVAEQLGLEVILGAFIAGAIVSLVDRDEVMTHPDFRRKLEAVGFGVFIPAFFVTSGVRFDLDALTSSVSNLVMVPIFLAALLAARGLARARVPHADRRPAHDGRLAHAGDVTPVHRRRHGDRDGPRSDRRGRERAADRRRTAVGPAVPAHRRRPLA
jgi:Kef-type K+ transport system membrane component KefB